MSAVLEGSVRKAGDRVRITAQLVDTSDGYHIFSKVYDRVLEDIFETQDEISLEIVNELRATLPENGEKPSLVRQVTEHSEAYDAYLKGMYCWNQWTPDAARQSVDHFQRAVDLDPEFAQAWGAMARSHTYLAAMGRAKPMRRRLRLCARRPPREPSSWTLKSKTPIWLWRSSGSSTTGIGQPRRRRSLRAMEINPDSVDVLHGYSLLPTGG